MYAEQIPLSVPFSERPGSNPDISAFAQRFITRQPPGDRYGYDTALLGQLVAAELERTRGSAEAQGPASIGQFILKTVTDCNLRCRYPCYEYVNDSWRALPPVMPDEVVAQTGERIGAYAMTANLPKVQMVFHGGEPLYMKQPEAYYDRIIPLLLDSVRKTAPDVPVELGMQTNAVLLRPSILDVLKQHGVALGISLDGDKIAHDAFRRTKGSGKGSHDLVMRGLAQLSRPEYAAMAHSILCVINIDADPNAVDDFLRQHAPPGVKYIDYLLPYATHDDPPRQPIDPARQNEAPYADWLLRIFWRSLRREAPHIRLFNSIMQLALGGQSSTEAIGPDAGGELIIRTDGAYELVDALKTTAPETVATGMGVATHSIEAAATLLRQSGHLGKKAVATACRSCPVLDVCGGGHIANRYSSERQFDNPSVYCRDLQVLTTEISRTAHYYTRRAVAHALGERGTSSSDANAGHSNCSSC